MSPLNTSIAVGLAALGLTGTSMHGVAGGAEAPNPATAEASAPTESVLLLYNGNVVSGIVARDGTNFVLRQRLGTLTFPRREVECVRGSLREIYLYKLERLAEFDPDEHMKLARWCLHQKLNADARERLASVVELSPGHREAQAMITSIDAHAEREAQHDPGIEQVGGGAIGVDRPSELNPAVLQGARRPSNVAALGQPAIFDLPPAVAVRRTQDFAQFVHPVLQKQCAKCHNERSAGSFQLIQARTTRELVDPLIVRSNMEAALTLVDPENLKQSLLLTSALLPHPPQNQPILISPKTQSYQNLSTWVQSLRISSDAEQAQAAGGFASDRAASNPGQAGSPLTPISALPRPTTPVPPTIAPNPVAVMPPQPGSPYGPPASSASVGPAGDAAPIGYGVPDDLAGVPTAPPMPPAAASTPTDAPTKPRKLDPATLQQFFMQRNNTP